MISALTRTMLKRKNRHRLRVRGVNFEYCSVKKRKQTESLEIGLLIMLKRGLTEQYWVNFCQLLLKIFISSNLLVISKKRSARV
jgi:hypothetical protein